MNPIQWLLQFSAALAQKRGGTVAPEIDAYAPVDARDDEVWLEIDGAALFVGNRRCPELWAALSSDAARYARVTQSREGLCHLMVYERVQASWRDWEGPSVLASLQDAQRLAHQLFLRGRETVENPRRAS